MKAPALVSPSMCGHAHDSAESQLICDTAQRLHAMLDAGVVVIGDLGADGQPHVSLPAVSMIGNPTAIANMVAALLEIVASVDRPTECAVCAHNFDRMIVAHLAMQDRIGSC
jgi:hypothetical protein